MSQLDDEFQAILSASAQRPFPPGSVERLLSHLGDEIILTDGQSTARILALSAHWQVVVLEWLLKYADVLPQRCAGELFERVARFSRLEHFTDSKPPLRFSFASQALFDQIKSRVTGVPTLEGSQAIFNAWLASPEGQVMLNDDAIDVEPIEDPAFVQFADALAAFRAAVLSRPAQAVVGSDDIEIDIEMEDGTAEPMEVDEAVEVEEEEEERPPSVQPSQPSQQQQAEMNEELIDNISQAKEAVSLLERASNMATQVTVDWSSFDFIATIPMQFVDRAISEIGLLSASEGVFLQVVERALNANLAELPFAQSCALFRAILLPRLKSLTSQPSRQLATMLTRLVAAQPDAFVGTVLSALAIDSSEFKFGPYHADLITKLLVDPAVTSTQIGNFVNSFLTGSSQRGTIWSEPLYDIISRLFMNPKMRIDVAGLEQLAREFARQQQLDPAWKSDSAAIAKRLASKITLSVNQIIQKFPDVLKALSMPALDALVSAVQQCKAPLTPKLINDIKKLTSS